MLNQVIAKCEMSSHLEAGRGESVYLMSSHAKLVVSAKIPTTRNSELSLCLVAEGLDLRRLCVELGQFGDFEKDVDDRLCAKTWDCGAADVVDARYQLAERIANTLCLRLVSRSPILV